MISIKLKRLKIKKTYIEFYENEDGTVEHILLESEGGALIVGNNKGVKTFLTENQEWSEDMIVTRAISMAESYYDNIEREDVNTI